MIWKRWKTVVKEHAEAIATELETTAARGERMIIEPVVGMVHHGQVASRVTLALTNERVIVWGEKDRNDIPLSTITHAQQSAQFHSGTRGGSLFIVLRTSAEDVALNFPEDVAPTWTAAIQKALAER